MLLNLGVSFIPSASPKGLNEVTCVNVLGVHLVRLLCSRRRAQCWGYRADKIDPAGLDYHDWPVCTRILELARFVRFLLCFVHTLFVSHNSTTLEMNVIRSNLLRGVEAEKGRNDCSSTGSAVLASRAQEVKGTRSPALGAGPGASPP